MDRQLFSLLVGAGVFLIIYIFGRISDAVKAHIAKNEAAAKRTQRQAKPKAKPGPRPRVAPQAAPRPAKTEGFRLPSEPEPLPVEGRRVTADKPAPSRPSAAGEQRTPGQQRAATLRQAVIWSEILKRKY